MRDPGRDNAGTCGGPWHGMFLRLPFFLDGVLLEDVGDLFVEGKVLLLPQLIACYPDLSQPGI